MTSMLPKVDCDVHPGVPGMDVLLPYLDEYWREQIVNRAITTLELASYPPNSPLTCRADWRDERGRSPSDPKKVASIVLDGMGSDIAVLNPLYGGQVAHNWHLGSAVNAALNDWITDKWLNADPRYRASIIVSTSDPETAVQQIERYAEDRRFIQVMLLVGNELTLGRRQYWPIFAACEKAGLPLAIHAGSMYRHPLTAVGWPTHQLQEYASMTHLFATQMQSLLSEGVFDKFPDLTIVLLESGVTWITPWMWRSEKTWKGVRGEIPWMNTTPSKAVMNRIRLSVQPFDGDTDAAGLEAFIDELGTDTTLLFSSDFPHAQFDGNAPLPTGISADLERRIRSENPLATYPRLKESL